MTSLNTTPAHTPQGASRTGSKAIKNAQIAIFSLMMAAGAVETADAQVQSLGTIDNGARNVWLLQDMGQQIVKRNDTSPYQQGFTIVRINTTNREDRRNNFTVMLDAYNDEIVVDNVGTNPSEAINTQVDGRPARKIHLDQLEAGRYVFQTILHASSPTNPNTTEPRVTRLFIEVDADGNQEVFAIDTPLLPSEPNHINRARGNRIGADTTAITFDDLGSGEMQITIPVPAMADQDPSTTSLDMDELRQTAASLSFELNDGTIITKTASEIDYDTTANTLTTSIIQAPGQRIVAIKTQHEGLEDMEVTGPLDVPQLIAKSIKVYPNPVRQGELLNLQLPDGIAALNVAYGVYDMNGREVMHGTLDEHTALMHNLSSGMYILKLALGKTVHTQKFLVK